MEEKMEIEYWDIERLIEYARNPRKNDHAVDNFAAGIREFGFRIPILVKSDGTIIDGHLRLKAAKKLNMAKVPVIISDDMTEAKLKAFRISVNKMAEFAEWDNELLRIEFEEISALGFDVDTTGFTEKDFEEIGFEKDGEGGTEGLTDPDELPELPEKPMSRVGDIWKLGDHRLLCGSSTDIELVESFMGNVKADLWLTDPPYNVAYEGKTADSLTIENDSMNDESFRSFLKDSYSSAHNIMKEGASFYIWHADSEGYNFRGTCRDVGLKVRQCLIWAKNAFVLGRQDYHWQHEPCLYGWKDGAAHTWETDRKQTTLLEFDRPQRNAEHPTMKPVALFEYLVTNSSRKGAVVFDGFCGSGTTVLACEKTGRTSYSIELDPRYCDVIINRWQDFTGKQATNEKTGINFGVLRS